MFDALNTAIKSVSLLVTGMWKPAADITSDTQLGKITQITCCIQILAFIFEVQDFLDTFFFCKLFFLVLFWNTAYGKCIQSV